MLFFRPWIPSLAAVCLFPASASAAAFDYEKSEAMITVRDGVRLHTEIYRPKGVQEKLPFLIIRSPYGFTNDKAAKMIPTNYKELADDGYIFVFQDIRGRYGSEGTFVMMRPLRTNKKDPKAFDESTDTYDTIEWLVNHVPGNNGRAGIFGVSYGGWLTVQALVDPHPALKAASEQASPADMFLGDDFHHNGALRLSYGFEYSAMMETGHENYSFKFDKFDTYDWYLSLGPLSEVNNQYLKEERPTWNNFVKHPNFDAFWQEQAVQLYFTHSTVPNLNVAGWWDQEDFWGPIKIYETIKKTDTNHLNYLVSGPWNHGGWGRSTGRTLGKIDFGSDTSAYFREKIQAPWFAHWLKDKGDFHQPEAQTFQTGTNRWMSYDTWPPRKNITDRKLYTTAGSGLSFQAPSSDAANDFDEYLSDPAHPVPYRNRPINPTYQGQGWATWLLEDQRFVYKRPDVAAWQTEPLDQDVVVTGDIVTHLFASTTGSDSDWIVKLIDVLPEGNLKDPPMSGYQLMISNEVLRGRFHESFEHPKPLEPNRVTEFTVDIHSNDHAFLKGHRIMLQVQSTWFPVIDRNPQKYVPNIYEAKASDYQKATQRIYRTKRYPTHVVLPVQSGT